MATEQISNGNNEEEHEEMEMSFLGSSAYLCRFPNPPGTAQPTSQQLTKNLPSNGTVGHLRRVPPPAFAVHASDCANEAFGDLGKILLRVVEAEDEPPAAYPAKRQTFGTQIELQHPVIAGGLSIEYCENR